MPNWIIVVLIILGSLILLGIALNVFKWLFGIILSVFGALFLVCSKTYEIISFPIRIVIKNIRYKKEYKFINENENFERI